MPKDSIELSPKHGVNPSLGVCFWCGEDDGTVLLLGKMKVSGHLADPDPEAPRKVIASTVPCDDCNAKMDTGITLMEAVDHKGKPDPTGRWWVIKEESVRRIIKDEEFLEEVLCHRKAFVDKETAKLLGLYKEDD